MITPKNTKKEIKAWAIVVRGGDTCLGWNKDERKWQYLIFQDKPSPNSVYLDKNRKVVKCKIII